MSQPQDMAAAVADTLLQRTGRSLGDWVALVQAEGPDPLDQPAVRRWLREVHQVKQNSQWAIAFAAAEAAGWSMPTPEEFADQLYSGRKGSLRPLHDAVVALALSLSAEVEVQGRATYLPLVRRTQFAAVAPGPRGTLRVGLRYRAEVPDDPRIEPAKGFAQATHWVHLPGDTSTDALQWLEPLLRAAHDQNG